MEIKKLAEFIGHQHPIYSIIAAPERGRFFSAGGDKTIVEWNINNPEIGIPIAQFQFTIYSLCLIKESNILLAGTSEGGIHFIDLTLRSEIKYIPLIGEGVFDIKYNPTYHLIVASTAKGNLVFIDYNNFSIISTLHMADDKIRSVAFNTQRPYLYVSCSNTMVYIIDLSQLKKVYEFPAHAWACNNIYYNAEKDELITASKDAHIRTWDIKNNFELIKNIPAHNYAIYQLIYNPVLNIYATASRDKTIKLWDINLEIICRINKENFEGHANSVNSICWIDEKHLVSGGDDRKAMLWEVS